MKIVLLGNLISISNNHKQSRRDIRSRSVDQDAVGVTIDLLIYASKCRVISLRSIYLTCRMSRHR